MRATAVPPGVAPEPGKRSAFMSAKVARRVIGKPRRPQPPPPGWAGRRVARRLRLDSEPERLIFHAFYAY